MNPLDTIMNEYGISSLPTNTTEAMAYVPFQPNNPQTYEPIVGFEHGTMYTALNKPFYGNKCDGEKND